MVLPTAVVRDGDRVLAHGSTGSRWLRRLAAGAPACLAVTAFDALVVARSAFESSMRYRSAVLFGQCQAITEQDAKRCALETTTDALIPGRRAEVRASTAKELAAVLVLALPIAEWSLKVSEGWPDDPPGDVAGPAWQACCPWCNATINRSPRRTCAMAYHCLLRYSACSSADRAGLAKLGTPRPGRADLDRQRRCGPRPCAPTPAPCPDRAW